MSTTKRQTPIALTIAGSDSSGGAGIQGDLKAFCAFGVYGASVITALTAQNTQGVQAVEPVAPDFVAAQFRSVISDLNVGAIKTGMLGTSQTVLAVASAIRECPQIPLVVDPVMVATSGDVLLAPGAVAALKSELIPAAALITPNLPEAAALLDCPPATNRVEAAEQAHSLLRLGAKAVLLKGGHMPGGGTGTGSIAVDIYIDEHGLNELEKPWIDTANTHGTGCTLSAAIAALLAGGTPMREAVQRAKTYVWQALYHGRDQGIGRGRSPLDHQFASRRSAKPA